MIIEVMFFQPVEFSPKIRRLSRPRSSCAGRCRSVTRRGAATLGARRVVCCEIQHSHSLGDPFARLTALLKIRTGELMP